jgi:hypothetical protein
MNRRTSGTGIDTSRDTGVLALDRLNGMDVRDRDGDKIGTVKGIDTDRDGAEAIRYLSITTGWLGTKRHVVPLDEVEWSRSDDCLVLPYGRDQLQSAPTYDERHELSHDDEDRIYDYYGRPGYWDAVRAKQTTPSPTPEIAEADVAAALARGKDPLRTDEPGMGHRDRGGVNDPGRRTMSGKGADQFGDQDRDDAYDRRPGVRRYDW